MVKVGIFTVTMLLVAVGLVVIFGEFRFGPSNTYHANFIDATRLKSGQKVRIAGVPVGSVKDVKLNPNNTVDVAFSVDKRYTLYSSTRAVIRYDNLVGDRFLEITSGPGELRKLPPGATIDQQHTQPALDLDALLGGLRPVLKGLGCRQDQHGQQLRDRAAAGPGRGAVQPAGQHQRVRVDAGCARPGHR